MAFMNPHTADSGSFDSKQYWLAQELQATNEEYALYALLLLRDHSYHLHSLEKLRTELNEKIKRTGLSHDRTPIEKEIRLIDAELSSEYPEQIRTKKNETFQKENMQKIMLFSPLPRLRFLLHKRFYLSIKNDTAPPIQEKKPDKAQEAAHPLLSALNPLSHPLTMSRRIMAILNALFIEKISFIAVTIMNGIFSSLVYLATGIQAAGDAWTAYRNAKSPQQKTRIVTNVLSFMLAGAGLGMVLAFFAGNLGATVGIGAMATAPVLIPGFLIAIASLTLWRTTYIFAMAKKDEMQARKAYAECSILKYHIRHEIHALEEKIKGLDIEMILQKNSKSSQLSPDELSTFDNYKKLSLSLLEKQARYAQLAATLHLKAQTLAHCQEERFKAGHTVAFNAVNMVAATFSLVASVLGAAVLLGATTVASFGAIPLALLITGITLAIFTDLFKSIDESRDYSYTKNLRNWFVNRGFKAANNPEDPQHPQAKKAKTSKISLAHEKLAHDENAALLPPPQPSPKAPTGSLKHASKHSSSFMQPGKASAHGPEQETKAAPSTKPVK